MASWYQRGPSEADLERARKESQSKEAWRFFLKKGESKRVIFLDDEPFCLWEHNPKVNGEFWHYYTCRQGVDPKDPICPLCMSKERKTYTGFLTVLDATGWENDSGERILYNRKLFAMTLKSLELFNLIKKKKTSLVGAQFELTRTSKDAVRVGDHWDFEKTVDPFKDETYWYASKLQNKKLPPEPYNYEELFMPLSSAEMRAIGASVKEPVEGGSDETGGDDDQLY